jgi:hypothetical protein
MPRINRNLMPFHNFTGSVRIKTGDQVSESKQFKVQMAYKELEKQQDLLSDKKRVHKFYNKQRYYKPGQQEEDIILSQESTKMNVDEFPCPDEQITYKPSIEIQRL